VLSEPQNATQNNVIWMPPMWWKEDYMNKKNSLLIGLLIFTVCSVFAKDYKFCRDDEYAKILYADSKEGLRIRDKPDLEKGKKIGLLNYCEEVEVIEYCNDIEIDGILSCWVKIKTKSGLVGYVFGGYLETASTLENKKNFEEALKNHEGLENVLNLPDGDYYPQKVIVNSPQLSRLKIEDYNGLAVRKNSIHIFDIKNYELKNSEGYDLGNGISEYRKPIVGYNDIPKDTRMIYSCNDRSGGGELYMFLMYKGTLTYLTISNCCAYKAQVVFIYGTEKVNPEIKYEVEFPWYSHTSTCEAYSTKDFSKDPDLTLTGDQREGPCFTLSEEGKASIIKFIGMETYKGQRVYSAVYKDKNVWIKDSDLRDYMYQTLEDVYDAVGFEYGL